MDDFQPTTAGGNHVLCTGVSITRILLQIKFPFPSATTLYFVRDTKFVSFFNITQTELNIFTCGKYNFNKMAPMDNFTWAFIRFVIHSWIAFVRLHKKSTKQLGNYRYNFIKPHQNGAGNENEVLYAKFSVVQSRELL